MNETSTLQTVLDAIKELTLSNKVASRQNIISLSGLSPSIVKDRVDELIEYGKVRRVERGVYQAVTVFPPSRAVSRTVLPDGISIIEVGDVVLKLTPQEELRLSGMYAGGVVQQQAATPSAPNPICILDVEEVAAILGCSCRAVEDRARAGDLPGIRFGEKSSWLFPADALSRAMNRLAEEEAQRRAQPEKPVAVLRRRNQPPVLPPL
jgi:hypothetical protein